MIIDKCPHCETSHVQAKDGFNEPFVAGQKDVWWRVIRCQNAACSRLILAVTGMRGDVKSMHPPASFELDSTTPIPQGIRDDFREAGLCLGAGCYRASMVMSRRFLQRCLKEQGCKQRNLVDAIDHAVEQGVLRRG